MHIFSGYATDDALLNDFGILSDHMFHNLKIFHGDLLSSAIALSPLRPYDLRLVGSLAYQRLYPFCALPLYHLARC